MSIKIAFSGIGGVGGYYGGLLAAHYQQSESVKIYFISRGDNLKAIQTKGIQINTGEEIITAVPELTTEHAEEIGIVDYLFCTTKSYDLEDNIKQLRPLIGPLTVIIPLLNGVNITQRIQKTVPDAKVWYGCVYIGARLSAPGQVNRFTTGDFLWFGEPEKDKERQEFLLKILADAGINALNPPDILLRVWKKFFLISTGATLTSYYNQSIGQILESHKDDYVHLGEELTAIAKAKGITFPDNIIQKVIEDQSKMPYDSTTSMHTDFIKGKRTELETLTGYVVEEGKKLHIPTPYYEMMYLKLKQHQ